jgi:hypothetical protein
MQFSQLQQLRRRYMSKMLTIRQLLQAALHNPLLTQMHNQQRRWENIHPLQEQTLHHSLGKALNNIALLLELILLQFIPHHPDNGLIADILEVVEGLLDGLGEGLLLAVLFDDLVTHREGVQFRVELGAFGEGIGDGEGQLLDFEAGRPHDEDALLCVTELRYVRVITAFGSGSRWGFWVC